MAKIREDLVGVVTAGEYTLRAGDTVPGDVTVGDHVLEAEKPAEKPKAEPKRRRQPDSEEE